MSKQEKLRCIHGRTEKQACRKCVEEDKSIIAMRIPSLPAIVAALEKERERSQKGAPDTCEYYDAGYTSGLTKAIDIVKELS